MDRGNHLCSGGRIEPLEGRIAPALLANASAVSFQDTDGDLVTVAFSEELFAGSGASLAVLLDAVFQFDSGNVRPAADGGDTAAPQQLQKIDLTAIPVPPGGAHPAIGVNITITAEAAGGGNGLVDVGHLRAASSLVGIPLGKVVVDGDLGQIDAGALDAATGAKSLDVVSMGARGLATQGAGASLESNITGALGQLLVRTDFVDAKLRVVNGTTASPARSFGKIGSLTILGDLKVSAGNTAAEAGFISAQGDIGPIKIGTDPAADGIFGSSGTKSGSIEASGAIKSVLVNGDIVGGNGQNSGAIRATTGMGDVTAGKLVAGVGSASGRISSSDNIGKLTLAAIEGNTATAGANAGAVFAGDRITSIKIAGDILGGRSLGNGSIAAGTSIGSVFVGGEIRGGDGDTSGRISAGDNIGAVTVLGGLVGGAGDDSGKIQASDNIASVTLGAKTDLPAPGSPDPVPAQITGGTGIRSGSVFAGERLGAVQVWGNINGNALNSGEGAASVQSGGYLASLKLHGNLIGGGAELSGAVSAGAGFGSAYVAGNLVGGAGSNAGSLLAGAKMGAATVLGKLIGGSGTSSGSILAGLDLEPNGTLASAKILGGIEGGAGTESASVRATGKVGSVTLGVKPQAGAALSNFLLGGTGANSGLIFSETAIGSVAIHGNVAGGAGAFSGSIRSFLSVAKVTILGALAGGNGQQSGSIQALDKIDPENALPGNLGTVSLGGAILGGAGTSSGAVIAEGGIKSLTAAALTGGNGPRSGTVQSGVGLAAFFEDFIKLGGASKVTIRGDIADGSGPDSARIDIGGKLGSLAVGGNVTGAQITVGRDIGTFSVAGDLSDARLSAFGKPGAKTDLAISKIIVGGDVTGSLLLAGYDRTGIGENGSAGIGSVAVAGDWIASSLVAGIADVLADGFGNGDDAAIDTFLLDAPARIAKIVIGGQALGTADPGDHFGFTANAIGKASIGGVAVALTDGLDILPVADVGDAMFREIARN